MARMHRDRVSKGRSSRSPTPQVEPEREAIVYETSLGTPTSFDGAIPSRRSEAFAGSPELDDIHRSMTAPLDFAEQAALLALDGSSVAPIHGSLPLNDLSAFPSGQQQPSAARTLQGRIEKISAKELKGWVWDPQTPDARIRLELVEDEIQLSVGIANLDRPDLVHLGCGDGQHGFSIELDDGQLTVGRHVLTLRCVETGAILPGSPITVECLRTTAASGADGALDTLSKSQSGLRGYIDKVTDDKIIGWIMTQDQPFHRNTVVLEEHGRVLARAVASQFRLDLLSAGVGDGCYAFELDLPRSVLDGQEHILDVVEEATGIRINKEPIRWLLSDDQAMTPHQAYAEMKDRSTPTGEGFDHIYSRAESVGVSSRAGYRATRHVGTRMLFDISDLVYYIGHHANLTGIQRVQSSIVLSMMEAQVLDASAVIFLSFNATTRTWGAIPTGFLVSLLRDLFLPEQQRLVRYSMEQASCGILPGTQPFDGTGALDDGNPSVLCLLGAAWVQQDYLHRVLMLKRCFGTRFVMMVHDLIPIYARETCDQDTVRVFENFMLRLLPHVDHLLTVSEYTARDVRRYLATLRIPEPPITVSKNGSSFADYLPKAAQPDQSALRTLPKRFVLFVATVEGRKNHRFMLDVWRRMVEAGDDPPDLVCVGRLGWKAGTFINPLVETDYLGGRIHLLRDISDFELRSLYERCLFTVCPTLYEGWGLPVGESLAMGKICVSSDRTSIPEVAGDCGVYIDIDDVTGTVEVIRNLTRDDKARTKLEAKIRRDYKPVTWHSVAERIVGACASAVAVKWREPYPDVALPYSTEISFGQLDRDIDGSGEPLLARIVEARMSHFTHDLLKQKSFLMGEEIRSTGIWALPERWGTWLCQSGGSVAFSLAEDASRFYYLYLRMRVSNWLSEQTVRLLANDEPVWEGSIGGHSKNISLRIHKRTDVVGPWSLCIKAQIRLDPALRNEIAAVDRRIPTIGFERLLVVPENDVRAQLHVLSKFVL